MNRYDRNWLENKNAFIVDPATLEWGSDSDQIHYQAYAETANHLLQRADLHRNMAQMFMLPIDDSAELKEVSFQLMLYAIVRMVEAEYNESLSRVVSDYLDLLSIADTDIINVLVEMLTKTPRVSESAIREHIQANI